ncbi:hypothetical protein ES708_34019 [subsurface metagenome]
MGSTPRTQRKAGMGGTAKQRGTRLRPSVYAVAGPETGKRDAGASGRLAAQLPVSSLTTPGPAFAGGFGVASKTPWQAGGNPEGSGQAAGWGAEMVQSPRSKVGPEMPVAGNACPRKFPLKK